MQKTDNKQAHRESRTEEPNKTGPTRRPSFVLLLYPQASSHPSRNLDEWDEEVVFLFLFVRLKNALRRVRWVEPGAEEAVFLFL